MELSLRASQYGAHLTLAVLMLVLVGTVACTTNPDGTRTMSPFPIPFAKPTDTVSFDRVEVALALGDMTGLVMVLEAKAQEHCRDRNPTSPKFTAESCQQITEAIGQAAVLKQAIITALKNPKVEIDWAEVVKVIKLLVSIAMRFA